LHGAFYKKPKVTTAVYVKFRFNS